MKKIYIHSQFGHEFELDQNFDSEFSILNRNGNDLTIMYKNEVHKATVLEENFQERIFRLKIDGVAMKFQIETEIDRKVKEMGMERGGSSKINKIEAPMPGLVLEILVKPGEKVEEGQALLILEAMKMENIIKSPGENVVSSIHVQKGDSVDKKALLIEME